MPSRKATSWSLWTPGEEDCETGSYLRLKETTILSFHTTLLHHGMVVAGLPYLFEGQPRFDEITGCSPYGASSIVGPDNSHLPTENELEGARWQGRYVALLTRALAPVREDIVKNLG